MFFDKNASIVSEDTALFEEMFFLFATLHWPAKEISQWCIYILIIHIDKSINLKVGSLKKERNGLKRKREKRLSYEYLNTQELYWKSLASDLIKQFIQTVNAWKLMSDFYLPCGNHLIDKSFFFFSLIVIPNTLPK